MKQVIKRFLQKYTNPVWDGQSADELAEMLEKELNQKKKGAVKLGGIDDLVSEALERASKKTEFIFEDDIDDIWDAMDVKEKHCILEKAGYEL